jgi:hypothetical protein
MCSKTIPLANRVELTTVAVQPNPKSKNSSHWYVTFKLACSVNFYPRQHNSNWQQYVFLKIKEFIREKYEYTYG